MDELQAKGKAAKDAARCLATVSAEDKKHAILRIAEKLNSSQADILDGNQLDCEVARQNGLADSLVDRLLLTSGRLENIISGVAAVAELTDPVGETIEMHTLPNGLKVGRRRVPLGVIGAIYESRPNVTADISTLCLKSGNAVILRGGSESLNSNIAMVKAIKDAISDTSVPDDSVQLVESTDRSLVDRMLKMREFIDLMIPRGGQALIDRVSAEALMPTVTGGIGVCHTYVDKSASLDMAINVAFNAKVSRPSVCNALDTLLVHRGTADVFLPEIARRFGKAGVTMRCDKRSFNVVNSIEAVRVASATGEDWSTEHLSLTIGVKVVDSLGEAIKHIEKYGGHSDAIVTDDSAAADRFLKEVDSSAVMVNASTRFNDGGEFGLGGEVAISTSKMHARGPMGVRELTSYKWVVIGTGHIRN